MKFQRIGAYTQPIWVSAGAMNKYLKANDNLFPITGVMIDMTSNTKNYIDLQNLY